MMHDVLTFARCIGTPEPLSCISYSTAGSGSNANALIVWFVFSEDALEPVLVIRSVRSPRANGALAQAYTNLEKLASLDADLFPAPLGKSTTFCAENYVSGRRMEDTDLETVFTKYLRFQRGAAVGTVDMEAEIRALVQELLTPEEAQKFLEACAPHLSSPTLPALIQHGDLTRDNVVMTARGARIIDCEHAHLTTVPGYDAYNLASHIPGQDAAAWLARYARELGFSYAPQHLALFPALHELLEAKKKSGRIREKVVYLETLLSFIPA